MATINGTAGNDVLTGTDVDFFGNGGDDTIHGAAGNDTIDGLGGSNQLFGDDGDDVFKISHFVASTSVVHSSYDGGAGFDTLDLSADNGPSDFFAVNEVNGNSFSFLTYLDNGNQGTLKVDSISNVEQIVLGGYEGQVLLQDWTTNLQIDASHVTTGASIKTGTGNDTIVGGAGNDDVSYEGGNDAVSLGSGFNQYIVDHLSGHADHVTVAGGTGTDELLIYAAALAGGPANIDLSAATNVIGATSFTFSDIDNVYAQGAALITGDDRNNVLGAFPDTFGSLTLNGAGGDDHLNGGISGDHLLGGDGNDTVDGSGANDLVQGGAGDDILYGGAGNNIVDGGDGNDWINGGGAVDDHINGVSVISGNDSLTGGAGNDHIWGSDQFVHAGAPDGADVIDGGDGGDYVNGNAGADTIHGGTGGDRLYGGGDDDVIYGDDGNDHINGNKGDDTIDGGAGGDELLGGQGNDQVYGGDGDDIISGDAGADTIHGGAGFDYMAGGADADVFAFSAYGPLSLSEAPLNTSGPTDVVTDYQDGTDKFSLGFAPAAVLAGSALTPAAAAVVAQQLFDGHAGDHEVAAVQVGADTYLFFSATGGGGVNSEVQVVGVASTAFDMSDFV